MAKSHTESHFPKPIAVMAAALLALLLALPLAADEVIYTWTDAAGVRHFAGQPPQGKEYRIVETLRQSSESPERSMPSAQAQPSQMLTQITEVEADPQEVQERCDQARRNLELLQQDRPALIRQQAGEPTALDDEARRELIEETERFIDEWC